MNIELINQMLINFDNIPKLKERKPTYLEIAGFPHYENVISNILAFFIETKEMHKLEDLFIKSIIECYFNTEIGNEKIITQSVSREVLTEKNKRIDILIETEKEIICIENKIFADLYNDLEEYSNHVLRIKETDKKIINIVLSMNKINDELMTNGFKNITYKELFEKIEKYLGTYISYTNSEYFKYLLDLKFTIKNLYGEEKMDQKTKEFFIENWERINELKIELNKLEKEIEDKAKKIRSALDLKENGITTNWIYQRRCVVHDIKIDEKNIVAIDYYLELKEPYCNIFIRKGEKILLYKIKKYIDEKFKKDYEISFKEDRISIKSKEYLTFDTDEIKVAFFIKEIVDIIEKNKDSIANI